MSASEKDGFDRASKVLAYVAACTALECDPISPILYELALLTRDGSDLVDAIHAMRNAERYDRVRAALTLLRDRDRERRFRGEPHLGHVNVMLEAQRLAREHER